MAGNSNKITADGLTQPMLVLEASTGVHISLAGDFGGGTVAVEQDVNGAWFPLLNEGTAVEFTGNSDVLANLRLGDRIRLNMTGSTAPDVNFKLAGCRFDS